MKCVLLFTVLFAAWMGSSEATTCEEIASCAVGMAEFANADQSKLKEACDAMHKVLKCFREGLQDCKDKNPGSESQLAPAEEQMKNLNNLVNQNCGSGASSVVTVSFTLLLAALLSFFF